MRTRSIAVAVIVMFAGLAHADPKGDVQAKLKEGMENYDLMDYDAARKSLNQAIAVAKKARMDKDPLVAKAYLSIGIVAFANSDIEGAKVSFLSAVQIDPKIQIDPAYKSAEMSKLLEEARAEATGGPPPGPGPGPEPTGPTVDCSSVKGLQHEIIDSAKGGAPLKIDAQLASDVKAQKVVVMFRAEGATDFTEVKLTGNGCSYTGAIPASALKGSLVHYYVAAYDGGNKPVASKGSAGSPNIIEITSPTKGGGGSDNEDPINGPKNIVKPTGGGGGGEISGGTVGGSVTVERKNPKVMIVLAGGTGFGYVTGTTEADNTVKTCCIGASLAVLMPEIGFYLKPNMSVSAAIRLGIPVGANVDGHATLAPGGLVRVRYGLSKTGDGIQVMGQAGAGILRNTIKIDNTMDPAQDTDIVAQGPLLIGAGIGYKKRVSNNLAFLVDVSALGAIAVTDHLGSAPHLNSGLTADLSLGLALGF